MADATEYPDLPPMTVGELRALLADLEDDAVIMVDGYEGGYDRPVLEQVPVVLSEPWTTGSYCGKWREQRIYESESSTLCWVLARPS